MWPVRECTKLSNLRGLWNPEVQCHIHKGLQYSLSSAESVIPISVRPILISSSHLRQGLYKGIFPVGLPVKILKALLPSS